MVTETELRQVSPKKLPAGRGWGVLVGNGGEPGMKVQVVTRKGKTWEATLTEEVTPGIWATDGTEPTTGRTRERLETRLEQRETWAESREKKRDAAWQASHDAVKDIPFGQPILVGHHSERRHRNALAKSERKGFEGLDHAKKADQHSQAAATIERNLERSIYDDDEDAIERLEEKIAGLEAERERVKYINSQIRKPVSKKVPMDEIGLTDREKADLLANAKYNGKVIYPSYVLQNLGGNINRCKKRVERLKRFSPSQ